MYVKLEPFGWNIYGETMGSAWLSLVEAINKNGVFTEDEDRKRLSLQNIRIKSATQALPDPLIEKYGNKKNVDEIINLTFNEEIMHDFDVVPSFSPGSKSYFARLKDRNTTKRIWPKRLSIFYKQGSVKLQIRKKGSKLFQPIL